jgi:hypothetical protein
MLPGSPLELVLHTLDIIKFMEQIPSYESDSCLAAQELAAFCGTQAIRLVIVFISVQHWIKYGASFIYNPF